MIPVRKQMLWERPFVAEQNAVNTFVQKTASLPGLVQMAIYPLAVVVSVLHIPFALTHALLSLIADRIAPAEVPKLSRQELVSFSRELHEKWTTRSLNLRQLNSPEIADAIALPVIDALRDAIDGLSDDSCDFSRLQQIATTLINLPATNSPDGHFLGLCIREFATRPLAAAKTRNLTDQTSGT